MNHYAMDTRFDVETAKKNDFGASFSNGMMLGLYLLMISNSVMGSH